jgi:uncharacterized protein
MVTCHSPKSLNQAAVLPALDLEKCGPIRLVVIQPTSFCNLDCDYCYLPDRHLKNRLSPELIEPIFRRIFSSPFFDGHFTVCWHAGEPLTVPISFYETVFENIRAVERQFHNGETTVHHSFQTNGTLITPAWCEFFKRHSVHVGVSIDGPAFLHDAHRQTRDGTGSHASTLRGIEYLKQHGINWNVISVITKDALDYPDELFHFFLENDITDVGFNMEETEGVNEHSSLHQQSLEAKFGAFIERIWDLSTQTNGEFKLREFESICGLAYYDQRLPDTDMNRPFVIINVDYQGNFSTFDPELLSVETHPYGNFILGNVLTDSLESVWETEKFQAIYQDINAGIQGCQATCDYFGVCGGGATSNKYWENGTFNSTETQACRLRIKVITDLVLFKLESELGLSNTP